MFEEAIKQSVREDNAEIVFEPITHSYHVGGKRLPSVSEIMRPLTDAYYSQIPSELLQNAANRGKRVHEAVEMFDVFGVECESKEIMPYLLGYKMALRLEKFSPIVNEQMLTNNEFCGTLDMIATHDNKLVIIDLKATSQINYELIEVQLAAYKELCVFNDKPIEKTFVLHLKPNSYKFVEITPNEDLWETLKGQWKANHE